MRPRLAFGHFSNRLPVGNDHLSTRQLLVLVSRVHLRPINANNWNPDWSHATAYVGPMVNGTQTTLLCPHQAPGAASVQKLSAGDTLDIIDSSVTFGIVLAAACVHQLRLVTLRIQIYLRIII